MPDMGTHPQTERPGQVSLANQPGMAALVAGHDWSATPLGPTNHWPEALKAGVQIIMSSRFPMFIWWGPDLINIYNDAYAPMLGKRHPAALGRPAAEIWYDIWDVVGPQTDLVIHRRQSTWNEEMLLVMERYGYTEETYFTFSYSPIGAGVGAGNNSGIGAGDHVAVGSCDDRAAGLFCAVTEDTSKVIGRRRLKTLRELATETADLGTASEALVTAATVIERNPLDIPFALLYEVSDDGAAATLAASAGISFGTRPATQINLDPAENSWALDLASEQVRVIDDLDRFVEEIPQGPWPDRPSQALLLPFAKPGESHPAGFMIAGISRYIRLDDDYRGFLSLVASHIATALANSRAYEAERARAEALAEIDRAKTTFFSNVSHEFRTPLTLMIGPLEDLLDDAPDLPPQHRNRIDTAHRNSLRLLKLVNALLDFARIEAGRMQALFEPTDLAALTADVASVFRSAVERGGINFVIDSPPLPEPVFVDREMWEKIVLNLISNAFKFTFEGEIRVSLRAAGSNACLSVSDTGIGIRADELPHIFERFHRVRDAGGRSIEGSGIGLALVQELVRLHAGTVEVETELGRGSRFTIAIPFGKAHLPADRIGGATAQRSSTMRAEVFVEEALRSLPSELEPGPRLDLPSVLSPASSIAVRPRLVVADDNVDMRAYVSRLLSRDYEITTAADGLAALEAIRANPPDLVLCDVMMPRLDGFGLLRALRSDPRTREIAVILLSARAGEEARIEGLEMGADDYLTKPFSARELLVRIQSALKIQQIRGETNRALRESEKHLSRLVDGLTRLHHLGRSLSQAATEAQGLPSILQGMLDLHHANRGRISLCQPGASGLQIAVAFGFESTPMPPDAEAAFSAAERISLLENRDLFIEDAASDPAFASCREAANSLGIRAAYSFPLLGRSGECLAVLSVYFPSAQLPDKLQLQLSDMHSRQAADFIEGVRAGQALRESEYQYRTLFDSMDEGFCTLEMIFDSTGRAVDSRFLEVNAAFEKQTGLQYAKGKRVRELAPDLEDHWFEIYSGVARTRHPARFENEARQLGRWYDGYAFPVDQPELNRVAVIFNDITERRRREEQLRQANRDLEQFAYSASHDLQEPIRTMAIYGDFLVKRHSHQLDAEGLQCLDFIRTGADRMATLVRDLLAYAQIVKLQGHPQLVDANEPLQTALSNLDVAIRESGAHVVAAPMPSVLAHRIHIQQLFQNLIGNAIKYRSPERAPMIQVTSGRQDGFWLFSIRDNGIGIEPEYQREIFGLFKRLHGGDEYSGTGIGLALCQRIVERYQGRIWVESEPGQGSTFHFMLPA